MLGDRKAFDSGELFHYFQVEDLIPENHLLRRIDAVLDTAWVREELAKCYSKIGRPSVDPEVVMRMVLLGYLYGMSENRLCDEIKMHMGYRWFCRLQPSDPVPDRTTLVKLRNNRWKQDIWQKLLEHTVTACVKAGLVSGRHVSIDGTQIEADASIHSLQPIEPPTSISDYLQRQDGSTEPKRDGEDEQESKRGDDDQPRGGGEGDFRGKKLRNDEVRSTTDPDARLYRKGNGVGAILSYLGHVCLDTKSRVWLAATVTLAQTSGEWDAALEMVDSVKTRFRDRLKVVTADKGYGIRRVLGGLWKRGLKAHIPVQGKRQERKPPRIREALKKVVQLAVFKSQRERRDQEIGRNEAVRATRTRGYAISRVHRLRVEHAIGEAKCCHGLDRARYRGLDKVRAQILLTGTVINLKRLAAHHARQPAQSVATPATTVPRLCEDRRKTADIDRKSALSARFSSLLGFYLSPRPHPEPA